jgi:hypothetical protein
MPATKKRASELLANWPSDGLRYELLRHQKWRKWSALQMAAALGIKEQHYRGYIAGTRGLPHRALCEAFSLGISAEVILALPKSKPRRD